MKKFFFVLGLFAGATHIHNVPFWPAPSRESRREAPADSSEVTAPALVLVTRLPHARPAMKFKDLHACAAFAFASLYFTLCIYKTEDTERRQ